jgi:hypothetical protein
MACAIVCVLLVVCLCHPICKGRRSPLFWATFGPLSDLSPGFSGSRTSFSCRYEPLGALGALDGRGPRGLALQSQLPRGGPGVAKGGAPETSGDHRL